eukprot:CAMPEP_0168496680 /NCGR_PEP_ID=MMETSP0228-20121227/72385_1 /TAXON_ID=133427 /ORGANISM="Protoceratium reticulatum, Strain CCCM 535 (=CCMP 1889)" /LENGTH=53 /DNA_ID=CAMNT_0008513553 /DNA_START=23 /DNA_END=181 /DNA_ORIENTATION=+
MIATLHLSADMSTGTDSASTGGNRKGHDSGASGRGGSGSMSGGLSTGLCGQCG